MSKGKKNQIDSVQTKINHRGRLQVQGDDMDKELSSPWSQDTPFPASLAITQLESLRTQCCRTILTLRAQAFQKAERYITNARHQDGLHAPVMKTFRNDNLPQKNKTARVDIEVIEGIAFINA